MVLSHPLFFAFVSLGEGVFASHGIVRAKRSTMMTDAVCSHAIISGVCSRREGSVAPCLINSPGLVKCVLSGLPLALAREQGRRVVTPWFCFIFVYLAAVIGHEHLPECCTLREREVITSERGGKHRVYQAMFLCVSFFVNCDSCFLF